MNNINKTMYIPLYGKALVSAKGLFLKDPDAERIWAEEGFPLKGKSKSKWLLGSRKLKKNLAASIGTSSSKVTKVIALPERLEALITSPSRTSLTICIKTTSNLSASTPKAVRAPFKRGT
jgi:hypothetical protein